jgi:ketosteroid isomerase-like protein
MPEDNLQLAREAYEAWNRGSAKWFKSHMTADAEVRPLRDFGDFDELYEGPDGWREFMQAWRRRWSRFEIRVERMEDMGEHGVLVLLTVEGVEKEGGEEVSTPASQWLKFREGKVAGIVALAPEAAERRHAQRD